MFLLPCSHHAGRLCEAACMNTMEEAASQLERDHVHSVYDKIAPYFNDNRYKAWPKVREFLLDLSPGSIVADIGGYTGSSSTHDVFVLFLNEKQKQFKKVKYVIFTYILLSRI